MTNARFCIIPARALGDQRLTPTAVLVLNALGMYGDRDGWSYPSINTIAKTIGSHRVSVSKAISLLVECGYLESRPKYRDDGGQGSNEYRILFDQASLFDQPRQEDSPPVAVPLPPHSDTATPPIAELGYTPHSQAAIPKNDPTLTPHGKDSVSDETGAGAPSDDQPRESDFKKVLFTEGLKLLGGDSGKNRSLVGRWIRDYGERAVVMAMLEAQRRSAVEPKAYIEKILKGGKKNGNRHSGFEQQNYRDGGEGFVTV